MGSFLLEGGSQTACKSLRDLAPYRLAYLIPLLDLLDTVVEDLGSLLLPCRIRTVSGACLTNLRLCCVLKN